MKRFLFILFVLLVGGSLILSACDYKLQSPIAPKSEAELTATTAPEEVEGQATEAPADTIRGNWQGEPLYESQLIARMKAAGWEGLVDYVSEDVTDYGPVERLIFGGQKEEQEHALSVAEAVRSEFNGTLWFMYGVIGSGEECGWRTPQSGLNLLRIEVYSTGNFLPEETSCRQAPG